jgi:hypothetical protein
MTLSAAPPTLPSGPTDNARLDQTVAVPAPGQVIVRTGEVEIRQRVLTALWQIVVARAPGIRLGGLPLTREPAAAALLAG